MKITSVSDNYVSINYLRRNFGDIERVLPFVPYFIITKKGKPFATLSATSANKKELMKKSSGAFKKTSLDRDDFWKQVLKKKSRKETISL